VKDIIKIDPRRLVIRQFEVVLDRVKDHQQNIDAKQWCVKTCIPTERPNVPLQLKVTQAGVDVDVPHGEFGFGFNGQAFQIMQGGGHISVSAFADRMLLWSGYHRSFARVATVSPAIMDRSILAALTNEADFVLGTDSPNKRFGEMVRGDRPPLLGDFLDDRFVMKVKFRKKRYELQIRSRLVAHNV
jgi:hypothetical protein